MLELSRAIYLLVGLLVIGVGVYLIGSLFSNSELKFDGKIIGISASCVLAIIFILWTKYYHMQEESREFNNLSKLL
jgi:hypothetical protein